MDNITLVNMDNLMGLLPEDLALKVDELMAGHWDEHGFSSGNKVFTTLIHAYQDLGLDTNKRREWQLPDIHGLLSSENVVVYRG